MKKIMMSAAVLALLATGCQNEVLVEQSEQQKGQLFTLEVGRGFESRTVLGETDANGITPTWWSEDDAIYVSGADGKVSGVLKFVGYGQNKSIATFSGYVTGGQPTELEHIVFPVPEGGKTIDMAARTPGKLDAPMIGTITGGTVETLKNVGGIIAFKSDKSYDVRAMKNNDNMAGGSYTFNPTTGTLTYAPGDADDTTPTYKPTDSEYVYVPIATTTQANDGSSTEELKNVTVDVLQDGTVISSAEVDVTPSQIVGDEENETTLPAISNWDGKAMDASWYDEAEVYFEISTASELAGLTSLVNNGTTFAGKTIELGANLDLNNHEWTPIGSAAADHGFMGNFDGNGYTIKNLKITSITPDADGYVYAGLFGVTEGTDANNENYIKNLTIENVSIDLEGHIVAAAIAYPYYTTLENIKVKGNVTIKGGDYTSGVLAYTRRCVNAKNISIEGNEGSSIEGSSTVGGVISDIQMNGELIANYSNFAASGLTVKGIKCVGGISGIISQQTLNGATVENVTIDCDDNRTGIVSGADGGKSTITNVSHENVTGATRIIGATYDKGYYVGQIVEAEGQKAVIYTIEDGVKAVSVAELNLNGKYWQNAMDWAAGLGEGWALASMEDLNKIYDLRFELNDVLEADNAENALFWEGDEYYKKNGSVYYALYMSSTEIPVGGADANGNKYFENRVFFKIFNKLGYSDVLYSAFDCINKYAPLRDNYFARAVYTMK